jgi:hypothetical protein
MILREWIDFYWVDPITKSPLPSNSIDNDQNDDDENDMIIKWNHEVTPDHVFLSLNLIGTNWVGNGIKEQVLSFRDGLSDLLNLQGGGLLSFESKELKDLFCGPDTIDWTEESLLTILRPTGGLTQQEDTMKWLRAELVAMPQALRLDFMELTSGLRLLPHDKVITVRRTDERWPFFHSCTNQLDLPRYKTSEELHTALLEALAHGGAGGFSEFAHISSGNGEPNSNVDVSSLQRNDLLEQSGLISRGFGGPLGFGGGPGGGLGAALNQLQFEAGGSDGGLLGSLIEALNGSRGGGLGEANEAATELRHALMDIGIRMGMDDDDGMGNDNQDREEEDDDEDDDEDNDCEEDEECGFFYEGSEGEEEDQIDDDDEPEEELGIPNEDDSMEEVDY